MFTLYTADCRGNPANNTYKNEINISESLSSYKDFKEAVKHDYVGAQYKDNKRSISNFIGSNVIILDCDNDHSENPMDWARPMPDIGKAFPNVKFAVHYSRSDMVRKKGKAARPKFHVFFPIEWTDDADKYAALKRKAASAFPYFDANALDSARFFFGTEEPVVSTWLTNDLTLDEFFANTPEADAEFETLSEEDQSIIAKVEEADYIPEGSRNDTMHKYACAVLKKYGDTNGKAEAKYQEMLAKCAPPLPDKDQVTIWKSASKYFKEEISKSPDYVSPDEFNMNFKYAPDDYSDVGQATVLAREYKGSIRYSPSTNFIVFNGSYWEESNPKAQGVVHALTKKQMKEADEALEQAQNTIQSEGVQDMLTKSGDVRAGVTLSMRQHAALVKYQLAKKYRTFVERRRDSKYITNALKEVQPMVEIDQRDLDADEFFLNTPSKTYDLRYGIDKPHAHDPEDYITKITTVDPSDEGMAIWKDALDTFFCLDDDLINYVQDIVGLAAIGKVYLEALIIAYGSGRNGKSTFWNTIARVLGTYSGNLSADTLTANNKRNVKPELAEAKGKRLIISAELEEGMRLSTSIVKHLCSTDDVYAEKKYKDPFAYTPTHTLVLYTNHLPKVGSLDEGTWRRLIVVPFGASIEGKSDIKNYADYLYKECGGAVLKWIMEGAQRIISKDFKLDPPQVVKDATAEYKETNDWMRQFLDACCDIDKRLTCGSGLLYQTYRNHCEKNGEFARSTTDFYQALEKAGFERKRTKKARLVKGLSIKDELDG